ncbi:glutathione peroxidase [Stylonychia lemnae]|uniref:Glutathione peroxidase n=1 Tax=Stylonychia lemnae TaxID=5949 RepID=A0A077ZWY7_STYLE|nr:glutathione peroxidase [Stylonychia lemnae]|eukprot:CDW74426.1 glutathione peroxidase [Stylonychia lemnae]
MEHSYASIWDIPATDINGTQYAKLGDKFGDVKPKLSLVVNVASRCGLTDSHYSQLTQIHQKYKPQGFEVMAFPCNQFGSQEPGTNKQILDFVCNKYGSTFHMFDKVDVNGDNAHDLYKYLKKQTRLARITWNFGKFLVNQEGKVLDYADPQVQPNELIPKIEKYLAI